MKRIFGFLIALSLCGAAYFAVAESGRESTLLPPQEVKIMYSTEKYGYRLKDINGTTRFNVLPDGGVAVFNSAGATVWGVSGASGSPLYGQKLNVEFVDMGMPMTSGNSKYTLTTTYDTYLIDLHETSAINPGGYQDGVSVYLPAGSAALDKWVLRLSNITEGTGATGIILVPANNAKMGNAVTDHVKMPNNLGGVTYAYTSANGHTTPVMRGGGSNMELVYRWVPGMSGGTWYFVSGTTK